MLDIPPPGVYVDMPFIHLLYPHTPPPQQVIYLAYTPPNHDLCIILK